MSFPTPLPDVRVTAAILLLASVLVAGPASAQLHADHLVCYRGHDDARLRGIVDIDTAQFGLSNNCRIRRARFFCAPAAKSVVEVNVDPLPVFAPPLRTDFVCYEARCPNTNLPDQTVTDQFGTRVFKLNRGSFLLCAPAVKGTEFCGDGSTNGSETCDGNDATSCPGACQPDCTCPAATPVPCATATPVLTATPVPTASPGPRFVDNSDGTVTDNETGLQWEKKDDTCPGIHCVNDGYRWSTSGTPPNGEAFTSFLATLNGGATGVGDCASSNGSTQTGGFAGHCDWRLPTIAELQTILLAPYPCGTSPCIDPVFGPTAAGFYWSSTTHALSPDYAWVVNFPDGNVNYDRKDSDPFVRAVRGGS